MSSRAGNKELLTHLETLLLFCFKILGWFLICFVLVFIYFNLFLAALRLHHCIGPCLVAAGGGHMLLFAVASLVAEHRV